MCKASASAFPLCEETGPRLCTAFKSPRFPLGGYGAVAAATFSPRGFPLVGAGAAAELSDQSLRCPGQGKRCDARASDAVTRLWRAHLHWAGSLKPYTALSLSIVPMG